MKRIGWIGTCIGLILIIAISNSWAADEPCDLRQSLHGDNERLGPDEKNRRGRHILGSSQFKIGR